MKQNDLNETTKFIITETIKYLQSQWYSKGNSYKTVVYRVLLLFVAYVCTPESAHNALVAECVFTNSASHDST